LENDVAITNHQSNSTDKKSIHKYKDIEDAIQRAIGSEINKKDSMIKTFKQYREK